jgi:hypothetical protein
MNAAIDQPPRHDAEALRIEIAEVDDVDGHDGNVTRRSTRGGPELLHCRWSVNAIFHAYMKPY